MYIIIKDAYDVGTTWSNDAKTKSSSPPFVGPARKYVTIPGWPHQFQRHVRIFGSANKDVHPATVRVENLQQDFLGGARRGRKRTGEHGGFTYPYAPWCWNIYQYLPHKSPSHVGKYTIHGAFGLGNPKGTMVISKIEPRKKLWFHQQKCWLKHGWVEL